MRFFELGFACILSLGSCQGSDAGAAQGPARPRRSGIIYSLHYAHGMWTHACGLYGGLWQSPLRSRMVPRLHACSCRLECSSTLRHKSFSQSDCVPSMRLPPTVNATRENSGNVSLIIFCTRTPMSSSCRSPRAARAGGKERRCCRRGTPLLSPSSRTDCCVLRSRVLSLSSFFASQPDLHTRDLM